MTDDDHSNDGSFIWVVGFVGVYLFTMCCLGSLALRSLSSSSLLQTIASRRYRRVDLAAAAAAAVAVPNPTEVV